MIIGMQPRLVQDPIGVVMIPKEVSFVVRKAAKHIPQCRDIADDIPRFFICLSSATTTIRQIHRPKLRFHKIAPHPDRPGLVKMERLVREIQNLKAVRRNCVPELVKQLILVAIDARDAYLLDLFTIDREQLHQILTCFLNRLAQPELQLLILEIPTGDFMIMKPQVVLEKFKNSLDEVHIIGINSSPWQLVELVQRATIQSFMDEKFATLREYCALPSSDRVRHFDLEMEPNSAIGFEFLAGWLLGYPVVYNCPLIPVPTMGVLAMQELRKVSLFATLQSTPGKGGTPPERLERVSVQEFTLPEALASPLRPNLDERISRVISRRDLRGRWSIEWSVTEELVTSPAVTC
jgi:hypothetical protein